MQCPAGQWTNKRAFVTARKAQFAVSTLCRLLEISRGWFYGFPASQPARDQRQAGREARDHALLPKIKTFFRVSKKCYGSKRIHPLPTGEWNIHREGDLLAAGEVVSERRVARIMNENNVSPLLRKRRKPITTDSNHKLKPSIARQAIAKQSAERGQICWNRSSTVRHQIRFGWPTSPISTRTKAGFIWRA